MVVVGLGEIARRGGIDSHDDVTGAATGIL